MPDGRFSRRALFALFAALGLAARAHADFEDDYGTGLKALDSGHLVEAREFLRKALAAQPNPVDKVKLNDADWQPYLPYHFLGVIAYKQGNCADAQAQWSNAINKRMLGRLIQLRQQETSLLASCQQKAGELAKEDKSTSAQSIGSTAAEPASSASAQAAPADKRATGVAKPAAGKQIAGSAAEKPQSDRPAPPPALVQAFDSYLAGHYQDAARLDPAVFTRPRVKFHAYLLRAAARFTQAEVDGNKNQLDDARADARAAYAIDAHTAPDTAMFSPKFRAFYEQAH